MSWHHINTRRISLQMCLFWNRGLGEKAVATYGFGIKKFLNYFDGQKTEYYVPTAEWDAYQDNLRQLLEKNIFVRTIPWEVQRYLERQLERWQTSFPKNLPGMSSGGLLNLQKQVAEEVAWTNSRTWMIYLLNDRIVEKVETMLRERTADDAQVKKYLLNFSSPLEMNGAMKERLALLELSLLRGALSHALFTEKLKSHVERFRHIPMFGFDHDPYPFEHFQNQIFEIEDAAYELAELQKSIRERKGQFETALRELQLAETDPLYDLIHMLKHTVFVRDYRDTLRQKMYLLDRGMYEEIGKRLGELTARETTNLTNEEIADGLQEHATIHFKKLAEERRKGFLILENEAGTEVYTGNEAHEKAKREIHSPPAHREHTLRGQSASSGLAKGRTKIIQTSDDLGKIKDGDVMVTYVTRQDFLPAMRRSAAIVTEEGWITNHAAIIARELGIPCVVGASQATTIFHDGDEAEVDANRGIVRKI